MSRSCAVSSIAASHVGNPARRCVTPGFALRTHTGKSATELRIPTYMPVLLLAVNEPITCRLRSDRTWLSMSESTRSGLPHPVRCGVGLVGDMSAGIAHQDRLVELPRRFHPEVVVDPAVAELDLAAVAGRGEIVAFVRGPGLTGQVECARRKHRGKADDAATADARASRGLRTCPTR